MELKGHERSHPVLEFAYAEWNRLQQLAASQHINSDCKPVWLGTWEQLQNVDATLLERMRNKHASIYSDSFFITESDNHIVIAGKGRRAVLFGVYQYAQEVWGMHAVYPQLDEASCEFSIQDSDKLSPFRPGEIRYYSPRMERRGFVFETIHDVPYLTAMLHWFGPNKINEVFFTFSLWDKVKEELAPEIIKRGIDVTLGGHSMKFIQGLYSSDVSMNQQEKVTADHPYTAKEQFDFEQLDWQQPMFEQIAHYCRSVPGLTRLSLWPEDVAAGNTSEFLQQYIAFTERLQTYLFHGGISVEVEHIAYNAGLAWSMLELEGESSQHIDTLFAYWGRDYRYSYEKSDHETDHRAERALCQWSEQTTKHGRKLTVFEYYSDHFMLTNLFSVLTKRITEDIAFYEGLGLHGMLNLVVPYRGDEDYPWKWAGGLNSYIFARAMWSNHIEPIMEEYYLYYPQHERKAVKEIIDLLEHKLSEVTSWNVPLFPARAVDPGKVDHAALYNQEIAAMLDDIAEQVGQAILHSSLEEHHRIIKLATYASGYAKRLSEQWLSVAK
ncbi:hypothetical protein [Paenibacillus solani]|uniref:hypothetical protein n=1 Tax=Paenibacillus solani TaxID=1705565 RepID=UPI003D28DE49